MQLEAHEIGVDISNILRYCATGRVEGLMQLDFALSPEERRLARRSSCSRGTHLKKARSSGTESRVSPGLWLKCGEIGLQGLLIPREYGGRGLTPVEGAIALEHWGMVVLTAGCRLRSALICSPVRSGHSAWHG